MNFKIFFKLNLCIFYLVVAFPAGSWGQYFNAEQKIKMGVQAYKIGDYAKALQEWSPLEKQKDPIVQNILGTMYERGLGVVQDGTVAIMWHRLSANQGNVESQYSLGLAYAQGRGTIKNNIFAYLWLAMSASKGDKDKIEMRDALGKIMPPSDLKKAHKLINYCSQNNYKDC